MPSTVTTISFNDLVPARGYSFAISAVDDDQNESEAATTVGATLLPNPEQVEIIPHSGYVSLSWLPVVPAEYVNHYAIYVSTSEFNSIAGMEPVRISDSPSVRIARLENGTAYHFAVATVNLSNGSRDTVVSFPATPNEDSEGPLFGDITVNGQPLTDGMTFGRSVVISVEASDPASVSLVEFLVDSKSEAKIYAGSPCYLWNWNVVRHEDGVHELTVRAYDSLGNVSEATFQVNTLLVVPDPPEITEPRSGMITNKELQHLKGIGEIATTVRVIRDGETVAEGVTDHKGAFGSELVLREGENILQAVAANRAGESEASSSVSLFLDTTLPGKPRNVEAIPKSGGQVKLSWQAPVDESVAGYVLYRSPSPFEGIDQAARLNNEMLTVTGYTDLTPEDRLWYYRVASIDQAGNEGILSDPVTVISDRVAPRAMTVSVISHGKTDGRRLAPALLEVVVTVSESLLTTPFVSIVPNGGTPYALRMEKKDEFTYSGEYTLQETTPSGTAFVLFSGRDVAGNRGTEIDDGETLLFDTDGPVLHRMAISPAAPIQNDELTRVTVIFGLTEKNRAGDSPALSYRLSAPGREITAIETLVQIATQDGDAQTWRASFLLPVDGGLTEPETLSFVFIAHDDLDNPGSEILPASRLQIYQGELPPLAIPVGLTATALPGGKVRLSWQEVADVSGYQLFRRNIGDNALQPLVRLEPQSGFEDTPPEDGVWVYAVASVRTVDELESQSGPSAEVSVKTDGVSPQPPQNLTVALTPQGIMLNWQPPAGAEQEKITYGLYRSADPEIADVAGLTPLPVELISSWSLIRRRRPANTVMP